MRGALFNKVLPNLLPDKRKQCLVSGNVYLYQPARFIALISR